METMTSDGISRLRAFVYVACFITIFCSCCCCCHCCDCGGDLSASPSGVVQSPVRRQIGRQTPRLSPSHSKFRSRVTTSYSHSLSWRSIELKTRSCKRAHFPLRRCFRSFRRLYRKAKQPYTIFSPARAVSCTTARHFRD